MNMKIFVDSLSEGERAELWLALSARRDAEAMQRALPLNEEMKLLVRAGEYIRAIKTYRLTHEDSSLIEAKYAVDAYKSTLTRSY